MSTNHHWLRGCGVPGTSLHCHHYPRTLKGVLQPELRKKASGRGRGLAGSSTASILHPSQAGCPPEAPRGLRQRCNTVKCRSLSSALTTDQKLLQVRALAPGWEAGVELATWSVWGVGTGAQYPGHEHNGLCNYPNPWLTGNRRPPGCRTWPPGLCVLTAPAEKPAGPGPACSWAATAMGTSPLRARLGREGRVY